MLANRLIENFLEFLAPRSCLINNELISDVKSPVKTISYSAIASLPSAKASDEILNEIIVSLGKENVAIDKALAVYSIDPQINIMNAIHAIKYQNYQNLAYELGKMLGNVVKNEIVERDYILVPVPLHKVKERERGYNQAEKIADGVSEVTGLKIELNLVTRTKYTISQTLLSDKERLNNVKGKFKISTECKNEKVIIVDDVVTTGNTVNEIALALKNAGASEIVVASLVKA